MLWLVSLALFSIASHCVWVWHGNSGNQMARVFGSLVAMQRSQNDIEVAVTQHLRGRICLTVGSDVADEFVDDLVADLFVSLLAAFEAQLDADFEIITKEFDRVVALDREIVGVDRRGELQFLHPAGRLRSAGFFASLGFFIEEFTIINDPANRRGSAGGNLDQVQASVLGQAEGIVEGHNAQLLLRLVQDPDFAGANLTVPAMERLTRLE